MRLTMLLMAVYLGLMAVLATQVDSRFFINDAIALFVFAVLLGGSLLMARVPGARR
ncbi:MAG TPA: hypothetical protein QGI71_03560 [Dehalococcoidia bacterium]|jgi:hypothetical protein|nr:hypothetical protein [Dehalococcoidia bacterium]